MKIQWLGHSCFKLVSNTGITIVTDPYDSYIGQTMQKVQADIVTVSHHHDDHNATQNVKGNPIILDKHGVFDIAGITIQNFKTYHDNKLGSLRGDNLVFKFNIDGLNICHLGDIGEMISAEIIQELLPIDVLLIPVGGKYTIDAFQAKEYTQYLAPCLILPMHYKTKSINIDIDPIDKFLDLFTKEEIEFIKNKEIEFSKLHLNKKKKRVIVFKSN